MVLGSLLLPPHQAVQALTSGPLGVNVRQTDWWLDISLSQELEEGSVSHLGPPSVEQWSVQSPVILQPSTASRKYQNCDSDLSI